MRKTRECHKCPHNMKRHADCLQCPWPSDTPHNDGVCMVDASKVALLCEQGNKIENDLPCDCFVEWFRQWVRLPSTTRDAIAIRIQDPASTCAHIGRTLGVSRAAISKAIKVARKNHHLPLPISNSQHIHRVTGSPIDLSSHI